MAKKRRARVTKGDKKSLYLRKKFISLRRIR